jgi:hypothetical protein
MSTMQAVDGISSHVLSLTIGRISRWVSEAAHVPLDRVVVMLPEVGGYMTRPTSDSLRNREGSMLVGNGSSSVEREK